MAPHRLTNLRRYKISNDVLILILENLDPVSLYRTCKAFRRVYIIAMEFQQIRYKFELAITGMKDGPVPYLERAPVARLQLLAIYRQDWPRLNWSHEQKLQLPSAAHVSVTGGFLHYVGAQTLDLLELPSCRTECSPAQTRHLRFITSPQVESVALDSSQALIVTSHTFGGPGEQIGIRLNIRELSNFKKHSGAPAPYYDFGTQSTIRVESISNKICGSKLVISIRFVGGMIKHLLMQWNTLHARWLDEDDIHFLSENYLLVVKKAHNASSLHLYNITDVTNVVSEREYELPEVWAHSDIEFCRNAAPWTDGSASCKALFYSDPSTRVLVLTARSRDMDHGTYNWLFINESYFRPARRGHCARVPWNQWGQYCLIRDVPPYTFVGKPQVVGSRVLYLENEIVQQGQIGRSRLNVIEFAPFPDAPANPSSRAWSSIGPRSLLVPNEMSRDLSSTTTDDKRLEEICVTEDNIVLLFEARRGVKPVNVLTFGAPASRSVQQAIRSPQL